NTGRMKAINPVVIQALRSSCCSPAEDRTAMVRRRSTVRFRKGAQVKGLNRTLRTWPGAVPGAKLALIRLARTRAGMWQAHAPGRAGGGAWPVLAAGPGCDTAST